MRILGAGVLTALLALRPSAAAQEAVTLAPVEKWSSVFGDQKIDLHYTIKAPKEFKGRATWQLTVSGRTILRRESAVTAAPKKPGQVDVRLEVPPVRDGVVVPATLSLALIADGQAKPTASHERTLWVYPRNPFVDRSAWLKELKIALFDPKGATAGIFKTMKIPYEEARNVAQIGELKDGLLIVGEGVSLAEHADVPEALLRAATRGLAVLCLAPADGVLLLPGADDLKLPAPESIAWRRQDVIAQFDKRLDAQAWPGDGKVVARTFALKAQDDKVVVAVGADPAHWPWIEAQFPNKGRWIACGFALADHWEDGPTPRFLFARILETLAPRPQDKLEQKTETQP